MKYVLDDKTIDKKLIKPSWRHVVDFRNVVAHEYFGLNADQIFNIAKVSALTLELEIVDLLKNLDNKEQIIWVIEETKKELIQTKRITSAEYLQELQKKLNLKKA